MKQVFILLLFLLCSKLLMSQPFIEWEQNYGGSESEILTSVIMTSDGGFLLGGKSESDNGDVGGNNGNVDFWAVKIDELGNVEWEQNYGGFSEESLLEVLTTNDGGFLLAGNSKSSSGDVSENNGNLDYWLVKTDSLGNIEWEQNYGGSDMDYYDIFY